MRRRISKPDSYSPALARLGLATPPPFVGRSSELSALAAALHDAVVLVIHGAVGSGKTRLGKQLALRGELAGALVPAYVRCVPGDAGVALRARAELALDALPGTLEATLRDEPRLLIIDDAHNLEHDDAARTYAEMVREPGAGRLLLLTREVLPLRRNDSQRFEMTLEGLDEVAARELWAHLEEIYGPTAAGTCDDAITRTRGMPLALRREYARAAAGESAWELDALEEDVRGALEAVAVMGIPIAPAAVAALSPGLEVEPALIELVSRQLIDPIEDGRFAIHDVVRDDVLNGIVPARRVELERAAAELVSTVGKGEADRRRMAWDSGDDGALGLLSPVDRMCEAIRHLIAAGDADEALARLVQDRDVAIRRGGGGEVMALASLIGALSPRDRRALDHIRAEIAARQGRVAEALEAGGPRDRVEAATLAFRSGDVAGACSALIELQAADDADERCRASAVLAELELARGEATRAHAIASSAFESDRASVGDAARARLHMALAAIEERAGRVSSARAALSRAASSGRLDPILSAQIEGRRAMCLAREGRASEAQRTLDTAERATREVDAVGVSDELHRCRALILARTGDTLTAAQHLRELVERRRERGDEIGALEAEIDLARIYERQGELASAAELAAACTTSAIRRGLRGMAAQARLVSAAIDVAELRLADARDQLAHLGADSAADEVVRQELAVLSSVVGAWSRDASQPPRAPLPPVDETRDEIDHGKLLAQLALAAGDSAAALDAARTAAVRAERAGRMADMAEALAMVSRLQLARGDKASAMAAASRAAREALSCGLTRARAGALLVLSALARDDGDVSAAAIYAQDAAALAAESGLSLERLVASQAMEVIADGDQARASEANEAQSAAAATMSEIALEAAGRMLCDLGLTAARPFRVVSSTGSESFVADASPDVLRLEERDLAVDGVREVIVRRGEQIADLRRRSLLKRLLFLFAAAPGRTFSKEDIVQTVWNVEYHPLRHDAALFTNIMRIRRLLGKDGADLIRVSEDGYKFCPNKDFLFVAPAEDE